MNILAYFCALFKGVIYGSTVFFTGKLTESTDILDILALRFLLSFAVMWLLKVTRILKIRVSAADLLKKTPDSPNVKYLILTALFEPVLYMFFETVGISETTGITTAVILALSPILSIIFEIIFLKESSTILQRVFLGCGIFGVIYIALNTSTSDGQNSVLGIVCLLAAILSGVFFTVYSRKSSKNYTSLERTYVSAMLGTVAFNSVNIVRHIFKGDILHYFDPYFSLDNIIGFAFLGIASTLIATVMNNYALSKLQVSTVSAFGGVSTVVTVLIGVIFNNEVVEYFHLIGFAFILVRIVGVSAIAIMRDKKKAKEAANNCIKTE